MKGIMKLKYLLVVLFFPVVFVLGYRSAMPTHAPDPLMGWQISSVDDLNFLKVIKDDYEDYIQKLSMNERNSRSPIMFFQGRNGQHAVKFFTGQNGTYKTHILIYDQDNKRTKVINAKGGHYAS